ncbi:MAG: YfbK domain-containing protein [Verrucomicrobiaceae bacterium]
MNDELYSFIEPELEARLVALVLGEASAFEKEELERIMAERPEVGIWKRRMEAVHGLLGDAAKVEDDAEWKLSGERRAKVLGVLKGTVEEEPIRVEVKKRRYSKQSLSALAAAIAIGVVIVGTSNRLKVKSEKSGVAAEFADRDERSREFGIAPTVETRFEAKLVEEQEALIRQEGIVAEKRNALAAVIQQNAIPYFDGGSDTNGRVADQSSVALDAIDAAMIPEVAMVEAEESLGEVGDQFGRNQHRGYSGTVESEPELAVKVEGKKVPGEEVADRYAYFSKDEGTEALLKRARVEKKPSAPGAPQAPTSSMARVVRRSAGTEELAKVDGEGFQEEHEVRFGMEPQTRGTRARVVASTTAVPQQVEVPAMEGMEEETRDNLRRGGMEKDLSLYAVVEDDVSLPGLTAVPEKKSQRPEVARKQMESDFMSLDLDGDLAPAPPVVELQEGVVGQEVAEMSGDFFAAPERDAKGGFSGGGVVVGKPVDFGDADGFGSGLGIGGGGETAALGYDYSLGSRKEDSGLRVEGKNHWGSESAVDAFSSAGNEGEREQLSTSRFQKEVPGVPKNDVASVAGIVTAGMRSGNGAVNLEAIDGALAVPEVGKNFKSRGRRLMESDEQLAQIELKYVDDPIRTNPSLSYEEDEQAGLPSIAMMLKKREPLNSTDLRKRQMRGLDQVWKDAVPYARSMEKVTGDEIRTAAGLEPPKTKLVELQELFYRSSVEKSDLLSKGLGENHPDVVAANKVLKELLGEAAAEVKKEEAEVLSESVGASSLAEKLDHIMIPAVSFEDTTIEEALNYLLLKAGIHDRVTLDNTQKGFNIVRYVRDQSRRRLSMEATEEMTAREFLEEIAERAGLEVEVDDFAVVVSDKGEKVEQWEYEKSGEVSSEFVDRKLRQIVVPQVDVLHSTLGELIDFLELRSKEFDSTTLEAGDKGMEFVLEEPGLADLELNVLQLRNAPLVEVAKHVANMTGTRFRVDGGRVVFFAHDDGVEKPLQADFETLVSEKGDSTFSLNVSDVSFKLAKAALAEGKWPEAAKVRPEEFVNAQDYDDSKPTQAEKVSCVIEQGRHPAMQQRNVMRVAMSTAALGRNATTPLRLTILLDQSGSMERADRAESVRRAFDLLAAQLTPADEVTLVGFARTTRLLAERVKGDQCGKLSQIVANTPTDGGTNLEQALATGLQLAKQQFVEKAQNRVILLTDGAANLGDALPETLAKQVEEMRKAGVAFDACGVGADGLNDDVLGALAKQGDGRYYFLDRPEDADEGFARQIAGALRPAAKNVKVQVIFNPERVEKFKLYGFEKHQLKKEDFRNDAVDAAEMAAEESGVALYHYQPMPEGRGDVGTVSVRFLDVATGQMVERTWNIPYEASQCDFAEAKPSLQLATVSALFGEKLKGSIMGERVDLKELRKAGDRLRPQYGHQRRFQELRTMLQQAGQ